MKRITKYCTTLEQISDDRFHSNAWDNLNDGVGNTSLFTSSTYNVKGGVKYSPQQLYAHDFGFELPEQYNIKKVDVEVRIRGNNVNTKVPICYFYYDGTIGHTPTSYSNNIFSQEKNINLSESFSNITYTMTTDEIKKYHLNKERLESDLFGVILQFNEAEQKDVGGVSVEWIRVSVEYEEPEYICEIRGFGTTNDWEAKYLYNIQPYTGFNLVFFVHNPITFVSNPKSVKIDIPLGVHIEEFHTSAGAVFDANTRMLHLDWSRNGSPYVSIKLKGRTTGLKKFQIIGDNHIGSTYRYVYIDKTYDIGADDQVSISSSDVRRWTESCFHFAVRTINEDGTASFNVWLDTKTNKSNHLIEWKLDKARSSEGVSIKSSTIDFIEFNVPKGKEVEIHFTGCFLPRTTGSNTLLLEAEDSLNTYTYDYVSLEPYTYVFDLSSHDMVFTNARLVSKIETGAYVYPVGVSEYDNTLVQDKSTLRLSKLKDIDFIGCVPLEQTHFNPKSTFKDTLLNTTYKNKTYMGKKGVIDETITLNVRLRPSQVTTMQGLIKMDKPVPVNANHLCFEGDALNHRGWVELYGITTEETNPHWYKCSLNVKYITHNLNTRFSINKGSRVSDYFLPELMTDILEYGDDFSEKFFIQTNGGYHYSRQIEDYHKRTSMPLPYGKSFTIKGMDKLSLKSQVNLNWYSTRNTENIHNNMSRVVKLIDAETGNAVVEYEWYDIDFSRSNEYNCRVICRVLHKGAYKTILNRNLILSNDVEYDSTDIGGIDIYGDELIFKIVADKLTIQDCGASGKELYIENIDLENGQYYFDVEFKNNNSENDSPDINNWIDISIKELEYSSEYSNYYSNLLVSPFPVPNKTTVFTRASEEGTIFYLLDDGTECSYMVNPYYQYHCGVDLQSKDGISIFDLDNNYTVVYITNGLVKLGINRYNGHMYLYKYDKYSKSYILVNQFNLTKYEDMNINSFTDDKIEVQVSDTIITMWRGHPYIHIAHPTEDILFRDIFSKVYGDGVGDKTSDVPMFFNLIDTTNLLPECVASDRKIRKSCWSISESEYTPVENNVYIEVTNNGGLAEPTTIKSDCHQGWSNMRFIIDGYAMVGESITETGFLHKIDYHFLTEGEHTIQAVYFNNGEYRWSQIITINIIDNAYHITPTFLPNMYYMENDFTCQLTYAKEPVVGETIIFNVNGLSYPKLTDSNGIAKLNNKLPAGTYKVHMSYGEEGNVLASAMKETKINKGYANITCNKSTVVRGSYILVQLKNNLDPNDDDVDESETYVKNKSIVLTINGVDYPRITDSNGRARLNINLPAGTYDLRVTFGGTSEYEGTIKNFELRVVDG